MTEDNVNKMRVILCRPGEKAETIEMEDSLEAMQKMVGGRIWSIKGRAEAPLDYVANPEKTRREFTEAEMQALQDVIAYNQPLKGSIYIKSGR